MKAKTDTRLFDAYSIRYMIIEKLMGNTLITVQLKISFYFSGTYFGSSR